MKINALLVIVWAGLLGSVNAFAPPLNVTIPPSCAVCFDMLEMEAESLTCLVR